MKEKKVGILGGMGPEATLTLFKEIIQRTPAKKDQDHIRVIIDNNPKIPDRTEAILGKGPSPLPEMLKSCIALENTGVDFIIIPCVSAHVFLDELQKKTTIEILSVFKEIANLISTQYKNIRKVGLLATSGTIQGGLFQQKLAEKGIETLTPEKESQEQVMAGIYAIKGATSINGYTCSRAKFVKAAQGLTENEAQGVIAGCNEIPLAFDQADIDVPLFNPLAVLAESAIKKATYIEN
jgi:aspartate racemase